MTALNEVYKCNVCGNIVEVLHVGKGQLVCCGQPMVLFQEKTENDEYREKHVPVADSTASGIKVTVGSVLHPMEEKHYIEWVELVRDGNVWRKMLHAGEQPVVEFECGKGPATIRSYCNLHGLWKSAV